MGRKRAVFDEAQLAAFVAGSTSWWAVARKLCPDRPTSLYGSVQSRVRELGLDTSHFTGKKLSHSGWTDADLRAAVVSSVNVADVIRKIGLIPAGGNYDQVKRRIAKLGLDISHFTGSGWSRGKHVATRPARPLDEVLVAGQWHASHQLKLRLFAAGLKTPACELCGWAQRTADGRIPVELDHINGDRFDNRLENLRILCPNCHSLQSTHRGRNQQLARAKRGCESQLVDSSISYHVASAVRRCDLVRESDICGSPRRIRTDT